MALLLSVYHLVQTAVAAYTGVLSYISISKVRTYEETTQKAAKYSNIAEHHLQTTRTTQGAGAISVISSTAVSFYLHLFSSLSPPIVPVLLSTALTAGLTAAHTHISNYWRGKAKIPAPGAGDYNDAITTSNQMRSLLGGLAVSWAVATLWYLWRWMG